MNKKYIEKAAEEHATSLYVNYTTNSDNVINCKSDFIAGVNWLLSVQEEIEATKKN